MRINALVSKLKNNPFFKDLFTYKSLAQFGKYVVTGLLSAAAEFSLLYLLTEYAGLWYILSNTAGYTAGFLLGFIINRSWSFRSKGSIVRQFLLYGLLFLVNLLLSNVFMYLLTSAAGLPYMLSKVFVAGMIVLWNFTIYKKVIYTEE